MGFGHRVYKSYDPRAKIIKRTAYEVFEVTGKNPLLDIALELERIALEDEYFVSRKLYPNVDFYSGLIYQAMGFPVEMFAVLFAIARTVGWVAQWEEMLLDPGQKIARPEADLRGRRRRATTCRWRQARKDAIDCGRIVRALIARVAWRSAAAARQAPPPSTARRPGSTCASRWRSARGRRARRPTSRTATTSRRTLAALGIKTVEQPFDGATPLGPVKMVNLIATIPGQRPDRIVLASHFDTKLFRDFRFVGASDGASSTAALLELARVLKARGRSCPSRSSCCSSTARKPSASGRAPTTPTAAATTSRRRASPAR